MSKRLHILVVEDDQDLRDILKEELERAGYAVTLARDGLDGLEQLRAARSRPDLILLDFQMPRMNGAEFRGEQLAIEEFADIPVVLLTADPAGEQKAVSLKTAYLRKPLNLSQLLSAIPQVMQPAATLRVEAPVTTELPSADVRPESGREQNAVAEVDDLRRRVQLLEDAVRARDTVLSVVAHDLRNPLNVVSLAANSLLQRELSSSMRRPVERIVRSAARAQRLVGDLLAISALESGQFELDVKQIGVSNLLFAALESQQGAAAEASVILAADLSPDLPAIEGDEERLLEVLENLVSNAIKFTPAGGSISVGASGREQSVLLWVKDSGCGIKPEQLPHIFDRFWQATKKERRGIGLGLSICKGIVEAHEGRIWAESTPGTGTTLFFTVPASAQPPTSLEKPPPANILLIDDRPENLTALCAILERPDYNVVTASSGKKALEMVLKHRFSVALLDIAMPGMNGFEVATHMKELQRSRDIPIIFVTAFGNDPEEIHRAYAAGGADYLVKPLDPEIVRKKVAVFVELARR